MTFINSLKKLGKKKTYRRTYSKRNHTRKYKGNVKKRYNGGYIYSKTLTQKHQVGIKILFIGYINNILYILYHNYI
jgi:hypothetical protein